MGVMVLTRTLMRLLIAGLVLIALGIGLTEYARRAEPAVAGATKKKKQGQPQAVTAPTTKALIETVAPEAVAPLELDGFSKAVVSLSSDTSADGLMTVLSGRFAVRALTSAETFAVAVIAVGEVTGLVRITPGAPVAALVARKNPITAVAVDGETVWWAEGSRVFALGPQGAMKPVTQFAAASVVALAARGGTLVAALVPKEGDPFSTDASGAVVKLESTGTATLIGGELVRPHDVLLAGDDVFFVAGYPSALVRASLDGTFSAQIAERADGPLAFDGEGLVHRLPQAGAPELRRVARAGGQAVTLARGEIDWVAAFAGQTWYTSVGIGARLYQVAPGQEPHELLAFKGVATGLAVVGARVVLSTANDDGTAFIRVR